MIRKTVRKKFLPQSEINEVKMTRKYLTLMTSLEAGSKSCVTSLPASATVTSRVTSLTMTSSTKLMPFSILQSAQAVEIGFLNTRNNLRNVLVYIHNTLHYYSPLTIEEINYYNYYKPILITINLYASVCIAVCWFAILPRKL